MTEVKDDKFVDKKLSKIASTPILLNSESAKQKISIIQEPEIIVDLTKSEISPESEELKKRKGATIRL